VTLVVWIYVLLRMRVRMGVYVLLVMRVCSVMGMHMVMNPMMPTRSMMPPVMSTITLIVRGATSMVWIY
jgi:hypothetical protein